MNHTQMAAAIALAGAALATSGCGGSSKPSSGTTSSAQTASSTVTQPAGHTEPSARTEPLTRAELIAQADVICRRVNQTRASITIKKKGEFVTVLPRLAAYERAAVAEMRKLTPPASMAKSWSQIIAGAQTVAEVTGAGTEHAKNGTLNDTQSLAARAAKGMQQMLAAATREGFKDCAQLS
jgi:hypothetical protein